MKKLSFLVCFVGIFALTLANAQAQTQQVRVEVSSNAPTGGVAITPLWVGFHDGSFDSFNPGEAASAGLEEIAELGSAAGLAGEFAATGRVGGTIGSPSGPPPIQPGESASAIFNLNANDNQFISYAAMVLPSSDYFVANGNPTAFDISALFGNNGESFSFNIGGTVWDAGTEVNDFATSPGNPLFGIPEGDGALSDDNDTGIITSVDGDPYSGFLNSPSGFDFSQLNFNDSNLYANGIATVTITAVPEPTSLAVLGFGLGGLFLRRRRG